jgi:RsiW-degrading membrane proteinase PrsW (M82 family)
MKFNKPWLQILIIGVLLFIGAEEALRVTKNPNFFPTLILLGAFVVPVAFVAFFYEHVKHREISLPLLTSCFIIGGVIGILIAGFIEFRVARGVSISSLFNVGLIEESAKLIFPLILFFMGKYRHEADGMLFGMAVGMGFAAFETMGYGLVIYVQSKGDLNTLWQVFLIRGFISPAGHAAWTGFLCAVLWRERERKGHAVINFNIVAAFIMAVVLHAVWDIANSINTQTTGQLIYVILGNVAIAAVSLSLVILRYREARKIPVKETARS